MRAIVNRGGALLQRQRSDMFGRVANDGGHGTSDQALVQHRSEQVVEQSGTTFRRHVVLKKAIDSRFMTAKDFAHRTQVLRCGSKGCTAYLRLPHTSRCTLLDGSLAGSRLRLRLHSPCLPEAWNGGDECRRISAACQSTHFVVPS